MKILASTTMSYDDSLLKDNLGNQTLPPCTNEIISKITKLNPKVQEKAKKTPMGVTPVEPRGVSSK